MGAGFPHPVRLKTRPFSGCLIFGENVAMRRWLARLPPRARWVVAVYLIGFADGTGDHVLWMTHGGIHAYAAFRYVPIQVFLVALIVLDPLTAVLVGLVRREGVWLAVAIMALDVAANWAGNWPAMPRFLLTFLPGELFAVFVFATAIPLLQAIAATPLPASVIRPACSRSPRPARIRTKNVQ